MNNSLSRSFLSDIEEELHRAVNRTDGPNLDEMRHMLAYHMGWEGEGAGPEAAGKRIRPLLVLLCNSSAGGEWQQALPAAAAVELIHNFSLIHDDIEDDSPLRRGRPTVWTKWGIAQAVNAGDALFTLAHLELLRLQDTVSPLIALKAANLLQRTCLHLTQGQYLDLSYQSRRDLTEEDYWPMVSGKTAALLSACTGLGAMIADVDQSIYEAYFEFGRLLGLAFQAQDDLLGLWGNAALTGKSAESDLVSGKKSLPVLFGLGRSGRFAERWHQGPIQAEEVRDLARQLEDEGARIYTQNASNRLTEQALKTLDSAKPQGLAGETLRALANQLLSRQG